MGKRDRKHRLKPTEAIALGVLGVILVGTFLLCLPVSTTAHGWSDFFTAFFTATSATCVTGLSIVTVGEFYTLFGQIVLLVMIQIGGLGFITFISLFIAMRRRTSLSDRKLVMQSTGALYLEGFRSQLRVIFAGTAIFELAGAVFLSIAFVPKMGWGEGIWNGLFTSISAFCNAGFALTDNSLMDFAANPLVCITVCVLVIVGGLGFFVWSDIREHKFRIRRYSLHTKVVLIVSGSLILVGWILFAVFEWNNPGTIGGLSVGGKIISSMFMSVTPRTAGFATVDYASLTQGGNVLNTVLMFIGGSPGSTAGGLKTTTIAVLILAAVCTAGRREETVIWRKRIDGESVFQASAVFFLYIIVILVALLCISGVETDQSLSAVVMEVVSAVCTVGLSANLTASLTLFSQIVLCILMFLGRVGGYTFILIFSAERQPAKVSHPRDNIMIG